MKHWCLGDCNLCPSAPSHRRDTPAVSHVAPPAPWAIQVKVGLLSHSSYKLVGGKWGSVRPVAGLRLIIPSAKNTSLEGEGCREGGSPAAWHGQLPVSRRR